MVRGLALSLPPFSVSGKFRKFVPCAFSGRMRDSDTPGLRMVRLDDSGRGDKCSSGKGEVPLRDAVWWIGADDG